MGDPENQAQRPPTDKGDGGEGTTYEGTTYEGTTYEGTTYEGGTEKADPGNEAQGNGDPGSDGDSKRYGRPTCISDLHLDC